MTATQRRWRAEVAAWARSGLSCKECAAKAGIHPGTLAGWKSKLSRRGAAEDGPADFVASLPSFGGSLLPSWPKSRALELAPAFWKQTLEQQDTQQRLAANVFRTATLVDHAPPV